MEYFTSSTNLYKDSGDVKELDFTNFEVRTGKLKAFKDDKIRQGMINFYAPWCKHCRTMVDLWNELGSSFKGKFKIAAVNCDNFYNYPLRKTFKLQHYPTIMYFNRKGEITEYEGDLDRDSLINFITDKLGCKEPIKFGAKRRKLSNLLKQC